MEFVLVEPSLENYWRALILFGRNTASYKFALAKSLIEFGQQPGNDLIHLEELAKPFSKHLCEHLAKIDQQGTRPVGRFLETCRAYNSGSASESELIDVTRKYGFKNVLDAFHIVNQGEISQRFFLDERRSSGGIRLTDQLFELFDQSCSGSLLNETESRWRLVETAWSLNISRNLIAVHADPEDGALFTQYSGRRTDITSSRDALNGYQKGKCFYCYRPISIVSGEENLADVDHFHPHKLKKWLPDCNWDGVWNLVLACSSCNRGIAGKFSLLPEVELLARLHKRNEYLITSHHPLRETLIQQTGSTTHARQNYLQTRYNEALSLLIRTWKTEPLGSQAL